MTEREEAMTHPGWIFPAITIFGCVFALASLPRAFADSNTVHFPRRVIDDETGRPVNDYAVQWGMREHQVNYILSRLVVWQLSEKSG